MRRMTSCRSRDRNGSNNDLARTLKGSLVHPGITTIQRRWRQQQQLRIPRGCVAGGPRWTRGAHPSVRSVYTFRLDWALFACFDWHHMTDHTRTAERGENGGGGGQTNRSSVITSFFSNPKSSAYFAITLGMHDTRMKNFFGANIGNSTFGTVRTRQQPSRFNSRAWKGRAGQGSNAQTQSTGSFARVDTLSTRVDARHTHTAGSFSRSMNNEHQASVKPVCE